MRGIRNNNKQICMSREIFILGNVMVEKKKGSCWGTRNEKEYQE